MNRINRTRLLAAGALVASALALASHAQAQYMWIDEKGLKQLSDRPPPPSVPLKNILKTPRGVPMAAEVAAEQAARPPATPAAGKPAPSLAERDADFRKRGKEKEEREQKELVAKADNAAKAENCERVRNYKLSMDSGARINTTDKNGERAFMNDEQRAEEAKKAAKALSACT
jgi:hypothetical protein